MKTKREEREIRKISREIIHTEIDVNAIKKLQQQFFQVMRKNNIKQGTKTKNGRLTDNFEWTICKVLFMSRIESAFELNLLFGDIPKDLLHY